MKALLVEMTIKEETISLTETIIRVEATLEVEVALEAEAVLEAEAALEAEMAPGAVLEVEAAPEAEVVPAEAVAVLAAEAVVAVLAAEAAAAVPVVAAAAVPAVPGEAGNPAVVHHPRPREALQLRSLLISVQEHGQPMKQEQPGNCRSQTAPTLRLSGDSSTEYGICSETTDIHTQAGSWSTESGTIWRPML